MRPDARLGLVGDGGEVRVALCVGGGTRQLFVGADGADRDERVGARCVVLVDDEHSEGRVGGAVRGGFGRFV